MSRKDFLDNFISAVDFQKPVEVTMDTILQELEEWDSLAALGVIVMFDLEYERTITGEDLERIVTLSDLYKLTGL